MRQIGQSVKPSELLVGDRFTSSVGQKYRVMSTEPLPDGALLTLQPEPDYAMPPTNWFDRDVGDRWTFGLPALRTGYEWLDPDSDDVYEIQYIVTHGDEGPEHYLWRIRTADDSGEWHKLPPFANSDDMRDIERWFHG